MLPLRTFESWQRQRRKKLQNRKSLYNICLIYMADAYHSIKTAALRTGLSAHAIRIWEKRYGAVEPSRTPTRRRVYSDDEIERLSLLRWLTQAGHSIGTVARLPTGKLRALAAESADRTAASPAPPGPPEAVAFVEECLAAIKALDARALDAGLKKAATALGVQGALQLVIAPLAQGIGDLWRAGTLTAAHEHFASAVVRVFLGHASRPFAAAESAPLLVIATPSGQLHELGALLAGAAAANIGWHIIYLGASLPPTEIAGAANQNRARAVALSLVYPEDDPRLESELLRLRELLSPGTAILVGGRAAPAYSEPLKKIGALQVRNLTDLCSKLDHLRKPATKSNL